jgi:hypothetical protein
MKGFGFACTLVASAGAVETALFKDAMFHDGSERTLFTPGDIYVLNGQYDVNTGGSVKVHNVNNSFPDTQFTATKHFKTSLQVQQTSLHQRKTTQHHI